MSPSPPPGRHHDGHRLLSRPSTWAEARFVANALRTETIGGAVLLGAAVIAIVLANSPWADSYMTLRDTEVGTDWFHLRLSLGHWAADGLLAIFFFVAGLELKREFLVGDLRSPAKAAVPVVAAFCGVAVPAVVFTAVVTAMGADGDALRGWAVPTATDIAFALAVLAVIGSHLPSGLRSFLLTLAVVDDLIAITIIAVFYTSGLDAGILALALLPLAAFAALTQRRIAPWWLLLPLAGLTWAFVHASGVHATVAGVLLGLVVPVKPRRRGVPSVSTLPADADVAHRFEHRIRPLSAGVAVPVFAFFASGVPVVGGGLGQTLRDPVAVGVVAGLVVGKLVGVLGSTYLLARFTRARLDDDLAWSDIAGLAILTGVGFTVSLLVGELAFGAGSERDQHVKVGILVGSLLAAALASLVLRRRNAVYRRIHELETRDDDGDGVPDCFQDRAGTSGEATR
ncbi:Na+/H+ antiporter NhaA [Phycicoccus duodecadis]|uniref:Na(+)/H(+) antiporter NhaA n=1 Tax=Phycicoccus duodecadis TaxID=173053 RepID=A0A2N3YI60_9MICO|nr:Na+/H+ antiporter NhaA [Phycicoccus duodecadis]PKW26530.1 sodium/proton antiporter (NhaA family) [Phycicoccus duodecadis]